MPNSVTEIAKAKINLALHVLGRRADGYHELDSIVAFADIGDELVITPSDQLSLTCSGMFGDQVPSGAENIILKAWAHLDKLFAAKAMALPRVHVALTKNLPVASGIGGGSADAAAMLRGLLRLTDQKLSATEITALAKSLGADVPVCFHEAACQMQGIGEIITSLSIELPRAIVLVNPLAECSTASVFTNLALKPGQSHMLPLELHSPIDWRNDMTYAALATQPIIANVLNSLKTEPAFSAVRMSGSGSTCFGLVGSMAQASAAAARLSVKNPCWWVRAAELGGGVA
jgi:4-diphosphocytidyl-2-C-methyl-D-erythritol kinase